MIGEGWANRDPGSLFTLGWIIIDRVYGDFDDRTLYSTLVITKDISENLLVTRNINTSVAVKRAILDSCQITRSVEEKFKINKYINLTITLDR